MPWHAHLLKWCLSCGSCWKDFYLNFWCCFMLRLSSHFLVKLAVHKFTVTSSILTFTDLFPLNCWKSLFTGKLWAWQKRNRNLSHSLCQIQTDFLSACSLNRAKVTEAASSVVYRHGTHKAWILRKKNQNRIFPCSILHISYSLKTTEVPNPNKNTSNFCLHTALNVYRLHFPLQFLMWPVTFMP